MIKVLDLFLLKTRHLLLHVMGWLALIGGDRIPSIAGIRGTHYYHDKHRSKTDTTP